MKYNKSCRIRSINYTKFKFIPKKNIKDLMNIIKFL